GLRLDLDLADRTAVGIAAVGERLVAFGSERPTQIVVEIVERLRSTRCLEQPDDATCSHRAEAAVCEFDLFRINLEHVRCDPSATVEHVGRGAAHADAGHPHRAAGMRAAADRNDIGVALYQSDFLERYA